MFKPISFFIGLKYTQARKKSRLVSFISLMTMIGLTLGVAVLITVLSVINGFDRELKNRILGIVPQATIASTQIMTNWDALAQDIAKQPHVDAVAPYTQLQGMLTAHGQVTGISISGIEPEYEKQVSIVHNYMKAGSLDALQKGKYGIVLGQDLADSLGLELHDPVTLVLPEATNSSAGVVPRFKRFEVVGIFKIGTQVDSMVGYIALNDASTLLRLPDGAQGIRLKLDDIFAAPEISESIIKKLPSNFYASNWTYTQGNLFSAIQMAKNMVGLLLLLIIIVATFNIISSLMMLVTDKKSDIAILRTLGASPLLITQIFMVQGTIIGVIGTGLGTVLGVILSLSIGSIVSWVNTTFGLNLLDAYFVHYLPSYLRWQDVLLVVSVSLLLSLLATIYPAMRAAKVQPAEALRYE
ncbi:lipoprotein-releasing ABC transporter permease subunit [Acinetobacter sp. A47]|uniref:lipoprotein-releasing ABC transporter permease subunit n=1 Tax=Acinetobacter sp. A47 TaxID=1561217 RepID=UPI000570E6A4|nr:lipoprotein-releasing ABC transporter permease subunit [Acinetobacter sp. A47]